MKYFGILIFTLFLSCSGNKEDIKSAGTYFDLKSFFGKEASRLQALNPEINKSVSRNSLEQIKKVSGINWKSELTLFIESDINKPAWKKSYKVIRRNDDIIYKSLDDNLKTREIRISRNKNGTVQKIIVKNHIKNSLYQSSEKLIYIPDSLYQIDKHQHVLIIGNNQYRISGRF